MAPSFISSQDSPDINEQKEGVALQEGEVDEETGWNDAASLRSLRFGHTTFSTHETKKHTKVHSSISHVREPNKTI